MTLRRLLRENWFEKIFALFLAVMLWTAVASETSSEIGVEVPLEYRNIPSQMEIAGDTTNTVEVRLRGSSNLVREISAGDISTTIDLHQIAAGEHIIPLSSKNVNAPFGVEVVRVNPSRVRLNLERTVSKALPVEPRIQGSAADGYQVSQILISPSTIEVQGPEGHVNLLQAVSTEPIVMNGQNAGFQVTVDLDVPDPLVRLHKSTTVQVRIEIQPKPQD